MTPICFVMMSARLDSNFSQYGSIIPVVIASHTKMECQYYVYLAEVMLWIRSTLDNTEIVSKDFGRTASIVWNVYSQ